MVYTLQAYSNFSSFVGDVVYNQIPITTLSFIYPTTLIGALHGWLGSLCRTTLKEQPSGPTILTHPSGILDGVGLLNKKTLQKYALNNCQYCGGYPDYLRRGTWHLHNIRRSICKEHLSFHVGFGRGKKRHSGATMRLIYVFGYRYKIFVGCFRYVGISSRQVASPFIL